jgi:hypothetical protein
VLQALAWLARENEVFGGKLEPALARLLQDERLQLARDQATGAALVAVVSPLADADRVTANDLRHLFVPTEFIGHGLGGGVAFATLNQCVYRNLSSTAMVR